MNTDYVFFGSDSAKNQISHSLFRSFHLFVLVLELQTCRAGLAAVVHLSIPTFGQAADHPRNGLTKKRLMKTKTTEKDMRAGLWKENIPCRTPKGKKQT